MPLPVRLALITGFICGVTAAPVFAAAGPAWGALYLTAGAAGSARLLAAELRRASDG